MSVVDDVKSRLDIVDVVSDYVPLKKAGNSYKAPCPFHTEKTPSFVVTPARQSWHCFGACSTGGDAINFIMRKEGLDFGEALRQLADRVGVEVRSRSEEQISHEDTLYRVNKEASSFYQKILAGDEGQAARKYLQERGLDAGTAASFELGMSPRGRDRLRNHLAELGLDLEHAVESGVLIKRDNGAIQDFFFGRLMFPIHDRRGRVVGFGARSLDGSEPKYINTAATSVFDKRATLYGLHKASSEIRKLDVAVFVEGYMDVIAAHQHGYANVIASMGTALTDRQVTAASVLCKTVILALDADAAGQQATMRSLESSWKALEGRKLGQRSKTDLKIALMPQDTDPDDTIRQDPMGWEAIVDSAKQYMEFAIQATVSQIDVSTAEGKAAAVAVLKPTILSETNGFKQEDYFEMLASALGVTREVLKVSIGNVQGLRSGPRKPGPSEPGGLSDRVFSGVDRDPLEEYVLAVLLQWPDLKTHAADHDGLEFVQLENRLVFTSWMDCTTIESLRSQLDEELHYHLDWLLDLDLGPVDTGSAGKAVKQSLERLRQRYLKEDQAGRLETWIPPKPDSGANPDSGDLEGAIVEVNKRLRKSYQTG